MAKEQVTKPGKLSISDLKTMLNKKAGINVAHDLQKDTPTLVKQWIPTGSTWLDSIICRGKKAGIPVGKIVELAGLEATGKSYMAAQIAGNAQKMGMIPVYFDSESAIDPSFLEKAGCDLNNILYIQAVSVESVLEQIEELIKNATNQYLFIWDSLANTPTNSDNEGDFNPQSSMSVKPRVMSKGFAKLTIPIAESQSTLLILNQLKTQITRPDGAAPDPKYWTTEQKYFAPGGKAPAFAYSLRIWLTQPKSKDDYVNDSKGFRIGSTVSAKLIKSRFGSQGRSCEFKILWGDIVGILDEESLWDAIQSSPAVTSGAWCSIKMADGVEKKFRVDEFVTLMRNEPKFKARVLELVDEEVIQKFDKREGTADQYYEKIETPPEEVTDENA